MKRKGETPSELASSWHLSPDLRHLNHGAFGACPIPVLEAQQRLREEMERDPVRFLAYEHEERLDGARRELARFVGAEWEGLAFTPNATTGVNAVLQSIELKAGDEIVTSDQEYNASRNALDAAAARAGAKVVVAHISLPVASEESVVSAIAGCVSPRTRLALVDHVTSQTAIVLPIRRIVAELGARGVDTLVDGAHAPGMLPLDLDDLGAAYYAANCHKWLCAPKGSGFLYVRADRRDRVRPPIVSHGANSARTDRSRLLVEFDWMGTHDPTPLLCIPDAIRFLETHLEGGWPAVLARNHALALRAQGLLVEAFGARAACPEQMIGAMASCLMRSTGSGSAEVSRARLRREFGIEVAVAAVGSWDAIRLSAHVYNELADYEHLSAALRILRGGAPEPPRT